MASTGFALAVVLGLTGCSSVYYSIGAETLPADRVGILRHEEPFDGIVIEEVDGQWRGMGAKKTYRLTPGPHALGVRVNLAFYSSARSVRWFDVKPGRVYSIRSLTDTEARQWGFWIVDDATGDRVDYASTRRPGAP